MVDYWYFAYGSNLNPTRKEDRTEEIRKDDPPKRARLPNYRFAFNKIKSSEKKTGYANIVPDSGAEVWGVIFRMSDVKLDDMDGYEGVPTNHYRRKIISVFTDDDEPHEAITYVAHDGKIQDDLKPEGWYLNHIIIGAKHYDLPPEYISEIEKLA